MFFRKKEKKLGLALGGGAARGIAHVGILQGLEDHGINVDIIVGTSSGSLIGGLYAAGLSIEDFLKVIPGLRWRDFAGFQLSRMGMMTSKPVEKLVQKLVGNIKFKDLKIPFAALATDISTGSGIVLNEPNLELAPAIRASTSFPGIYGPVKLNNHYFFDGGASANVPSAVTKQLGATTIIAVDVIPDINLDHTPKHFALLADRGLDLLLRGVSRQNDHIADLVLKPVTEYFHSFSVKKGMKLVKLGRKCVEDNIDQIKKVVQ